MGFLLNSEHSGFSAVSVRGARPWDPGTHRSTRFVITSMLLCDKPGSFAENRLPNLHKKPFVPFQWLLNSWKYSDHHCPHASNDFSCLYILHKIFVKGCWGFFANNTVHSCVSLQQALEEWPDSSVQRCAPAWFSTCSHWQHLGVGRTLVHVPYGGGWHTAASHSLSVFTGFSVVSLTLGEGFWGRSWK